jgi:membrane protein
MLLPGKGIQWKDFLKDIAREWQKDKLDTVAGGLTFFGVLAIFPFLLFAVSLTSLIIEPSTTSTLIAELYRVAPRAAADILSERIRALTTGKSPALLTFGALGTIWAASGGLAALMEALNTMYGVEERRPFWKRRGLCVALTLGGAVLVVAASLIAIATPSVANYLGGPVATLLVWTRIPVAALLIIAVLAVLYYVLPDVEQQFKFITPGSVVAVVIWVVASLGFSFYAGKFGDYEVSYGALGGVIVLLMWMWITFMAVLLGAEMNAIIEHRSPDGKLVGAKHMDDKGLDVPKTAKEEGEVPKPEAVVEALADAKKDGKGAAPALALTTPQVSDAEHPAPTQGNPLVDVMLGVSALVVGFFVGNKIRS